MQAMARASRRAVAVTFFGAIGVERVSAAPGSGEFLGRGLADTCATTSVDLAGPPGEKYSSPGCVAASQRDAPPWCDENTEYGIRSIDVEEPELGGTAHRKYLIKFPVASTCAGGEYGSAARPAPLMLFFHGQTGTAIGALSRPWTGETRPTCADANGFISVYPQGLDDYLNGVEDANGIPTRNGKDSNLGTGWNVGSGGDERTCWKESDGNLVPPTEYSCYKSCTQLGRCGRCNWSTCHDDVAFTKALLKALTEEFCVDMTRIYVAGESNGGMLTHHLYNRLPRAFAAVAPIYGLPLLGYLMDGEGELLRSSAELRQTAFLQFHGRQDRVIPLHGGMAPMAAWTWYYEPLGAVTNIWARSHGCNMTAPVQAQLPFADDTTVQCQEYPKCKTGRRVLWCAYDGKHGAAPALNGGPNSLFWFFNQFRRSSPASWD